MLVIAGKYLSSYPKRNLISSIAKIATFNAKKSYVVVSKDENTIVCWHPDQVPPFEHTKPLPVFAPEINEGDSVLKVQYRKDEKYRFKPDGPTTKEVMKLTYTTKHRWYPNSLHKYKDPEPDPDREGL